MSELVDVPAATVEKDLRGAAQDRKREKDSRIKWSYTLGFDWHNHNHNHNQNHSQAPGAEAGAPPSRPVKKHSDRSHANLAKTYANVNKDSRNWDVSNNRFRAQVRPRHEIAVEARQQDVPDARARAQAQDDEEAALTRAHEETAVDAAAEDVTYSFDHAGAPARTADLGAFAAASNAQQTEKMVRREYEVLDDNGQALRGKKARQNLRGRHGAASADAGSEVATDDGFQII